MKSRLFAAVLLGLVSGHAIAAKTQPATPWLQVEMAGAKADTVAQVYRDQLMLWYRASEAMDEAELAALPQADYFAFRPDLTRFNIEEGEQSGAWTFLPPQQGRWPVAAVQVIDRSDAGRYRILARVYCDAPTPECRKLREDTAAMAPPEPSLASDSAAYSAWQQLAMHESCTPGPKHMPAPHYAAPLVRNGLGGTVALRLLVNPCGEVRSVRLAESSGHPALDQASIDTAWSWRIYPERQEEGAIVRVPVDFVPPQLDAAPSNRIDRADR
ncbi:energy transducer TonB [Lysobacter sp.]|uniref:energy transducer TonB n=1 Tax=Lysobacter sp. TaxID=72226 RepID=UPI002D55AA00|nr:energy transducer TonB [Lysobacter sp.]HZX77046.1 energy transducer TonB [Lysobacter sp.]